MKSTYVHINQNGGYRTRLYCYETTADTVLGTLLILHGMAEHHERYLEFIEKLNQEGFDVYTYDHRGHGTDKKLSDLGYIAKKNGSGLLVNDARNIFLYIKENKRSDKLAVLGHSMGSLVLRCLIQEEDSMDCALVCSTTMPPVGLSNIGLCLANLACVFRGPKKKSKFLDKTLFGGKPYTSLCSRTSCDWLTRNNTAVGKYIDDPYCGFICTTSFYRDLVRLAKRAALKRNIAKTRKDLPIAFFAGDKDPVGGYAKEVILLHKTFEHLGFAETSLTIYQGARHELLNEINAEEVTEDLISVLHKHLG